jgi:membrane protease YdiL (CAAX protease family)
MKINAKAKVDTDRSGKQKFSVKASRKGKKTPLYILLLFIVVQLSPILFITPLLSYFQGQGMDRATAASHTSGWLIVWTMGLGFIAAMILIFRDKQFFNIWKGKKAGFLEAIGWGILGFFLVYFAQIIAALIEVELFGIAPGSQNTASITNLVEVVPWALFAVVFFGPVLEELVFRRVVFGSLNQTTNFFLATAVSALAFAAVHMEFSHLLIYFSTGLVLAFLYQKTKRIITPIIAHILLNGFVMIVQLNMDKLENFLKQFETMQ